MNQAHRSWTVQSLLVALPLVLAGAGASSAQRLENPATVDVCARVPGSEVAALFGLELQQERRIASDGDPSRCVYRLGRSGSEETVEGVVLWLYVPEDYDALLPYVEGTKEPVEGLGDAAILFHDPGDGRWKLRCLVRGRFAVEATASTSDGARKVGRLAVERLSR